MGQGDAAVSVVDVAAPIAIVCLPWAVRGTGAFDWLVSEDAVLESAQVAACALAAMWFLRAARPLDRTIRSATWLGAAALMVFVIGEEVAWGTRLIDRGITAIELVNDQGDTTLHNIGAGLDVSFAGLALASGAAVAWIALGAGSRPSLAVWFVLPLAYGLSRLFVDADYDYAKLSEAFELCFAIGAARLARSEAMIPNGSPLRGGENLDTQVVLHLVPLLGFDVTRIATDEDAFDDGARGA